VTTLIAGLALRVRLGPGARFAIVHCLGILTSMFSAVFFSRGIVNLWYGGRKKLKSLAIGQVWKPEGAAAGATFAAADESTDTARAAKLAAPAKGNGPRAGKPQLRNRAQPGVPPKKPGSTQ
jgi:preprotein translocase subunit SecD